MLKRRHLVNDANVSFPEDSQRVCNVQVFRGCDGPDLGADFFMCVITDTSNAFSLVARFEEVV